jgi:hypothetical protein
VLFVAWGAVAIVSLLGAEYRWVGVVLVGSWILGRGLAALARWWMRRRGEPPTGGALRWPHRDGVRCRIRALPGGARTEAGRGRAPDPPVERGRPRGEAESMAVLRIVLLAVAAAILYGIVHDQVTARVAIEYFTVAHPPIVDSEDPTVLGLLWGVIATWWVGAILGILLAVAARAGSRERRTARDLVRPVAVLLGIMAASALAAGVLGWILGRSGTVVLLGDIARAVPTARHARFLGVWWAHLASYAVGAIGGLVLAIRVWGARNPRVGAPSDAPRGATT